MQQITRRNFLQYSSLTTLGCYLGLHRLNRPDEWFANVKHLGVQLWSVRKDMFENPAATIAALAKMGYREVEGFGYDPESSKIFGLHHSEFSALLKSNGISMPSCHAGFSLASYDFVKKDLTDAAKKTINVAAQMGQKYLIQGYIGEPERVKIKELITVFQAVAKYCQRNGLKFGYHNHDFEFKISLDGKLLYEWLLTEIDPKLMVMQSDLYWFAYAYQNPVEWFKKYPGRFELCHVKDMAKTEQRETIEVGDGIINFTEIFSKRTLAGFKYYVIELEHYLTSPLEGVRKSRDYFINQLKFK